MENRYYEQLNKVKLMLEEQGHRIMYICVFGSQNYQMDLYTDDYQSDLDMKAIVVPTLDDLLKNTKPVSKVIDIENGQVNVMGLRKWIEVLLKGNPAYVETLFTDYYLIDEMFKEQVRYFLDNRDSVVRMLEPRMIRAMYGMMLEKEKAMCHPYPTIKHKIEKFGYDGKQLSHAIRLYDIMYEYYINGKAFKDCLIPTLDTYKYSIDYPSFKQFLIDIKLNKFDLDEAVKFSGLFMNAGKELRDKFGKNKEAEENIDYSLKYELFEVSRDIIKQRIFDDYLQDIKTLSWDEVVDELNLTL